MHENLRNYGYDVELAREDYQFGPEPHLVILDNEALGEQAQWLASTKLIRDSSSAPIILVGKLSPDKQILEEEGISSVLKYPLRIPELIRFIDDILDPHRHSTFLVSERDRQERISHTFEDLKLKGKRVLVAEDNMINQRVAVSMLEQMGIVSDCVSNGKEAIEAARHYDYDAILMDCRMPIVDGYEAAKVIRNLSKHYQDCPILAVTANALKSERYKSDDALMDMHISKPITIDELKNSLERCLSPHPALSTDSPLHRSTPSLNSEILRSSVLDSIQRVSEKVGNNLLEEVISLFFENSPTLIAQIREAIHDKRGDQIESLAHKLKGSARNLGAIIMADHCTKLENLGELSQFSESHGLIDQIEEDFLKVRHLLSERYDLK